jgi:inward rectifier potassium channel
VEVYADYSFFLCRNQFYICLYLLCNWDRTFRITVQTVNAVKFGRFLFFSAQTFTTVVMVTSVPLVLTSLSAAEALIGLLSFAIATGLFFEGLVNPQLFLKFRIMR